jgi:regulator of sigma E protease
VVGGDPVNQKLSRHATDAERQVLRHELGLDRSLPEQYLFYLKQCATFNFGRSWATNQQITEMIGVAAPAENDDGLPVANARLMVTDVSKKGPAETAGITGGDYLINISDGMMTVSATSVAAVSSFISPRASTTLFVAYEHLGEVRTATVTPVVGISEKGAAIGVYMDMVGKLQLSPLAALTHGAVKTWQYTELTAVGIARFLKETVTGKANLDEVTGPVGIVKAVGDASHIGLANLLLFTALISINLAIINIIPFPALDGGRLLFIAIEALTRRPIPVRAANLMNNLGFALLIGLMLLVTYHDVVKLF